MRGPYDGDEVDRDRRRTTAGMAVAVASALLIVVVVAAVLLHARRASPDLPASPAAERPSPSPAATSPSPAPRPSRTFPELTADQVRHHPDARVDVSPQDLPATASRVVARTWTVCLGTCPRSREQVVDERQAALEVSHDGFATGALYKLDLTENVSHAVDDWYLVDGYDHAALVDSRGHRRPVRLGDPVAPTEVTGPLVYSRQGLAYVDVAGRVLHPLEQGDEASWDWQGAADTWFWGTYVLVEDTTVTRHGVLWRRPDGTFGSTLLPIGETSGGPGMLRAGRAGTMAVVEHFSTPRVAHVSTDYGATWQVRVVPADVLSGGSLPADWPTWPVR